jgi:hypothetical protein
MPKTLSKHDPNLLAAVGRLERAQRTNAFILIAFGLLAQAVAVSGEPLHPVAGLPFIAIGVFCWLWGDPALLATAAVLFLFSTVPSIVTRLSLLGPDPIVTLAGLGGWELVIVVGVKVVLAFMSVQQFFMFRLLYGTQRMTSDAANLALIPPMVTNRTDVYARWARSAGGVGAVAALVGFGATFVDPTAFATRVFAELGGALGATALGLGLGAAFSPTDERRAALAGMGFGMASYLLAAFALLRL